MGKTIVAVLVYIALISIGMHFIFSNGVTYGQSDNATSLNNTGGRSQFIVNIRGISSFTEPNMVALINTDNDVQVKKVDLDKAIIQPGQEKSFSPSKMIDVNIQMTKPVKPNSEVTACVLQLGSGNFNQRINCNIVFAQENTGQPQKIIVPL